MVLVAGGAEKVAGDLRQVGGEIGMPTKEMLSLAGIKGGSSPKHKWTDYELDIVRRDYTGRNASARMIAAKLGVTICAVKGQVQKLGIAQQKSPDWTPRELERLAALIHQHSVPQIAKMLHRSPNAVKIKATRLKMGLRNRDDWYTKSEVYEILGVDHRKVQSWIDAGELKARPHGDRHPQKNGMAMWHIDVDALRSFIIKHSGELLGRNVDLQQIVWIIAGEMNVYKEMGGK
jgi:DNA-binding CsgD family transcriptional regulator